MSEYIQDQHTSKNQISIPEAKQIIHFHSLHSQNLISRCKAIKSGLHFFKNEIKVLKTIGMCNYAAFIVSIHQKMQ